MRGRPQGSLTYRAYEGANSELIALLEQYGGWIDPGSAGYARQTGIARKMLAGEIDAHLSSNDFSGRTVAEQLLWGGASAPCAEIVRMARTGRLAAGGSALALDAISACTGP